MNKTITWINKTEGRDKFCKAIQYGARFLKWHFNNTGNKDLSSRFSGLFGGMRDARKLFRLFKTVNECHKIMELLKKKDDDDLNKTLVILQRAFFGDHKPNSKTGSTFWFLALVCAVVQNVRNLLKNLQKQNETIQLILNSQTQEQNDKAQLKLAQLKKEIFDMYLNIIKSAADMITAGQAAQIWPNLLKKDANDGWCGMGGLVSSVITSYQLF